MGGRWRACDLLLYQSMTSSAIRPERVVDIIPAFLAASRRCSALTRCLERALSLPSESGSDRRCLFTRGAADGLFFVGAWSFSQGSVRGIEGLCEKLVTREGGMIV